MLRVCKTCKESKDISLFVNAKNCKYGKSYMCLDCAKIKYEKYNHSISGLNRYKRINDLRAKNPIFKARETAWNFVKKHFHKKGSCEVCGCNNNIERHHDDYNKPMAVRFLCKKHHAEWHKSHIALDIGNNYRQTLITRIS